MQIWSSTISRANRLRCHANVLQPLSQRLQHGKIASPPTKSLAGSDRNGAEGGQSRVGSQTRPDHTPLGSESLQLSGRFDEPSKLALRNHEHTHKQPIRAVGSRDPAQKAAYRHFCRSKRFAHVRKRLTAHFRGQSPSEKGGVTWISLRRHSLLRQHSNEHSPSQLWPFSSFWTRWMAAVRHEKAGRSTVFLPLKPHPLRKAAQEWAGRVLQAQCGHQAAPLQVDLDSIHAASSPVVTIQRMWEEAAIWLMRQDGLAQVVGFLSRTCGSSHVPPYMLEDMMEYILVTLQTQPDVAVDQTQLAMLLIELSREGLQKYEAIARQHQVKLVLQSGTESMLRELDLWSTAGVPVAPRAHLHAISRLVQSDLSNVAVQHLRNFLKQPLDLDLSKQQVDSHYQDSTPYNYLEHIQAVSVTVIRAASREDKGQSHSLEIISEMVEAGVPLNVQICNVVMLGAVEHGDVVTAFNVYDMLRKHGLAPTDYTFAILAKGCKEDLSQPHRLIRVIQEAIEDKILLTSPFVATEVLHCLYKQHLEDERSDIFQLIQSAYLSMFKAGALIKLGLTKDSILTSEADRMEPSIPALGILIHAYLFEHGSQDNDTIVLAKWQLYNRLRHLAEQGHALFTDLLERDYTSNAFAASFARSAKYLPFAMDVLMDMRNNGQLERTRIEQQSLPAGAAPETTNVWSSLHKHLLDRLVEDVILTRSGIPTVRELLTDNNHDDSVSMTLSRPSSTTIGILHRALCEHSDKSNDYLSRAELVFHELVRVIPTDTGYRLTMLAAYFKHEKWSEALMCIESMKELGIWQEPHVHGALARQIATAKRNVPRLADSERSVALPDESQSNAYT